VCQWEERCVFKCVKREEMEVVENEGLETTSSSSQINSEPNQPLVIHDLPWIEKYRPKSLSELIAHEEIVNICMSSPRQLSQGQLSF
jgi:hypothetical protein